jgi:nitroreductase
MNPHKQVTPDHSIQPWIAERWSPYAFADRPVSDDDLRSLFEAARWAASSYNEQPWRYIVATRTNPTEFDRLLSCLVEGNRVWAKAAPVLALGCTSLSFALNGKTNAAADRGKLRRGRGFRPDGLLTVVMISLAGRDGSRALREAAGVIRAWWRPAAAGAYRFGQFGVRRWER